MARRPEGWRLVRDPRTGFYFVRFSLDGVRWSRSTGQRNPGPAKVEAARIHADALAGRIGHSSSPKSEVAVNEEGRKGRASGRAVKVPKALALDVLAALWLSTLGGALDDRTVEAYEGYMKTHWLGFFGSLEGITEARADAYVRSRLKSVKRKTVLKELSALRRFLQWCVGEGHLEREPVVTSPRRTATGVEYKGGTYRKVRVDLTEAEVEAVLVELPERTRKGFAMRAFFTLMYESTLRRGTLFELMTPQDYAPGRELLRIRDEIDKARYGREVPLSARARAALDFACLKKKGLIFGRGDYRYVLTKAALKAGFSPERAKHLSYHDFRHASLTHLATRSTDLVGMAYLAGHRDVGTTARMCSRLANS